MELRRDLHVAESNAGTLGFHQVWPEAKHIKQEPQLANQLSMLHAEHAED